MTSPGAISRDAARLVATRTLLDLVSAPDIGAIPVSAHQRALCQAVSGGPVQDVPPLVGWGADVAERSGRTYMVGAASVPWPRMVYLIAGIRTGKSFIVAALALRAALTCDLHQLRPAEVARVSVLSLRRDLAAVVREHLEGLLAASPLMRALVVKRDAESVWVRHPSGRQVEVAVVAGAAAGSAIVARWSAGVIVDEAPRYVGAGEGTVTLEDLIAAARGRLLEGAQMLMIGSPWAARGPVFDAVHRYWHRPSREVLVLRASAPALNPAWWTPARVVEVQEANPTSYLADVLGEFVELSTDALSSHDIEACRGAYDVLQPGARFVHVAAIDPATRLNAWTLVVARRGLDGHVEVALAKQWVPEHGRTLDPDVIVPEIAALLQPYGVTVLYSDQHLAMALGFVARRSGLALVHIPMDQQEKAAIVAELAAKLSLRQVKLPDVAQLVDDLKRVRRIVTSGRTGLRIDLPRTADGRHCDYVPALLLCMRHLAKPHPEPVTVLDDGGYAKLISKHKRLRLVRGGRR